MVKPVSETTDQSEASSCNRWFWSWLVGRTTVWFLFTLLTFRNAPLDLVEWLSWGHHFAWGYPKHPPLPAWLAEAAHRATGDIWGVYLLSYLLIALRYGVHGDSRWSFYGRDWR